MKRLFLIFSLIGINSFATALILQVPAEYPTIQNAISATGAGDTVLVQPGTYQENISFQGRAITVASTFLLTGDDTAIEQTIINGGNTNRCVRFNNDETAASLLTGFTITNGSTGYYGGGIYCDDASPTLRNLIVTGNSAEGGGGMAFFSDAMSNCHDITVEGNNATEGGGIYCHDSGDITMTNLVLCNNSSAHGGGLLVSYSEPVFYNPVIYDNSSPFGGGVYVFNYSTPQFINATLTGNSADYGGAFYCSDLQCQPVITSSILWQNTPQEVFATSSLYPPIITYTDVEDGSGQSWFGEGCIDSDPLFFDPGNSDFHLTIGSPCIDAGDPTAPPDPDGTVVDMGAFPFLQTESTNTFACEYGLSGNYPNPFNSQTTIHYTLAQTGPVTIKIYTITGQLVTTLVNQVQLAGTHQIIWDGVDNLGRTLPSGLYITNLNSGGFQRYSKMTLLK